MRSWTPIPYSGEKEEDEMPGTGSLSSSSSFFESLHDASLARSESFVGGYTDGKKENRTYGNSSLFHDVKYYTNIINNECSNNGEIFLNIIYIIPRNSKIESLYLGSFLIFNMQ